MSVSFFESISGVDQILIAKGTAQTSPVWERREKANARPKEIAELMDSKNDTIEELRRSIL